MRRKLAATLSVITLASFGCGEDAYQDVRAAGPDDGEATRDERATGRDEPPGRDDRKGEVGIVPEQVEVQPEEIEWAPVPEGLPAGAELAELQGDSAGAELFVLRMRMPDGYHFPAHSHPHAERVTVLQGTMHLASGDRLARGDAQAFPPGSFVAIPSGSPHAVWAEDETIIQVTAVGPLDVQFVEPAGEGR